MYAITAVATTDFEKIKSPEHEQNANERSTFYVNTKFVSDKWDREVGKAITSVLEDMEDYTNEFFEDGEIEVRAFKGIYLQINGRLGKDKIMGDVYDNDGIADTVEGEEMTLFNLGYHGFDVDDIELYITTLSKQKIHVDIRITPVPEEK